MFNEALHAEQLYDEALSVSYEAINPASCQFRYIAIKSATFGYKQVQTATSCSRRGFYRHVVLETTRKIQVHVTIYCNEPTIPRKLHNWMLSFPTIDKITYFGRQFYK